MSASPPIRVGVIGLGRAFTLMLPAFRKDSRVALVGAYDPREEARSEFAREFDAPVFTTADGLASSKDVEVLYIASPHQFHAEHAILGAENGKHILVEKPMALSLEECDEMIMACRQADVVLMVGHSHSFDAPYVEARKLIDSGEYGSVRMIHAVNYTDFLYRLRRQEELTKAPGAGVVFNQAAHQVDVVRLLARAEVSKVRAITGNWDPARPTEGAYTALLWFEGGAFASLTYSGYAHFDSDELCASISEMGHVKDPQEYGSTRQRLASIRTSDEEEQAKAESGYGGSRYNSTGSSETGPAYHQHFGFIVISCEHADIRPLPNEIRIYGHTEIKRVPLSLPETPRAGVVDTLERAVRKGKPPMQDGHWGRATLGTCLAILESSSHMHDVDFNH